MRVTFHWILSLRLIIIFKYGRFLFAQGARYFPVTPLEIIQGAGWLWIDAGYHWPSSIPLLTSGKIINQSINQLISQSINRPINQACNVIYLLVTYDHPLNVKHSLRITTYTWSNRLLHIEIPTEVRTRCFSRCSLRWVFQQPQYPISVPEIHCP